MEIYGLTQLGMMCFSFLDEQMKFQVTIADFFKNFWERAVRKKRELVFTLHILKLQDMLHLWVMHEVSKTDHLHVRM